LIICLVLKNDFKKLNEPYNINNLNCNTLNIFEGLDVSLNLDIITSANTTETVYSSNLFPAIGDGNLYEYITTNVDSGFMFVVKRVLMKHLQVAHPIMSTTADNSFYCESIIVNISQGLYSESGLTPEEFATSIPENFKSKWLRYNYTISDQSVIELLKIKNKIKS
jgi:hypothetical protein